MAQRNPSDGCSTMINTENQSSSNDPCPSVQSPLPYMLAGLVTMAVLVTIALSILAWPHIKRYLYLASARNPQDDEINVQNACSFADGAHAKPLPVDLEKIVVIMAGENKPTHIATMCKLQL